MVIQYSYSWEDLGKQEAVFRVLVGSVLQLAKERQQAEDPPNVSGVFTKIILKDYFNSGLLHNSILTSSPSIMSYNEDGLLGRIYQSFANEKERLARVHQVALFESTEEFVGEHSGFSNLGIKNFMYIFIYYFLFGSLVLVAFCVHRLVGFAKRIARSFGSCFLPKNLPKIETIFD